MNKLTKTDMEHKLADCKIMQNAKVTTSETVIKQEPEDWPLSGADVNDSHFVIKSEIDCCGNSDMDQLNGDRVKLFLEVVKQEVCSNSLKVEPSSSSCVDVPTTVIDFGVAYIKTEPSLAQDNVPQDILHTDHNPSASDSNTVLTINTGSPLMEQSQGGQTNTKYISCNIYDYQCSYETAIKKGTIICTGEKSIHCKNCDYKCSTEIDLKTHMKTHIVNTLLACEHCDYKSYYKSCLRTHMKAHTGEKPFKCTQCDYKCALAYGLRSHMKMHTGEKPFSCTYCDYKCLRPGTLKTHIMSHTGEKPYHCNYCDYKSAQYANLNTHLRTHTGEKPHTCELCDYKCAHPSSLRNHMQTHYRNKKPFSCNSCEYKTVWRHTLLKHKSKMHCK